jgi:hypothetical protein
MDKNEWNKIIEVNKRQLFKIFIAGAIVGAGIISLVWYIYIQTGFIL